MMKDVLLLFISLNVITLVIEYIYSLVENQAFEYSLRNLVVYLVFSLAYVFFIQKRK